MCLNEAYKVKKTILGKWYLSNVENGDVIYINEVTADIIKILGKKEMDEEELVHALCGIYDATDEEIRGDVRETIETLMEYNVIF